MTVWPSVNAGPPSDSWRSASYIALSPTAPSKASPASASAATSRLGHGKHVARLYRLALGFEQVRLHHELSRGSGSLGEELLDANLDRLGHARCFALARPVELGLRAVGLAFALLRFEPQLLHHALGLKQALVAKLALGPRFTAQQPG